MDAEVDAAAWRADAEADSATDAAPIADGPNDAAAKGDGSTEAAGDATRDSADAD
jgi:hypothetical protein